MDDRENGRDRQLCRVSVSSGPMFPISLSYVFQMTHEVSRPVFRGVVYSGVSWARCGGHHSIGRDCA